MMRDSLLHLALALIACFALIHLQPSSASASALASRLRLSLSRDEVAFSSPPELAHQPVTADEWNQAQAHPDQHDQRGLEQQQHGSFVPHREMQPPGSIILHPADSSQSSIDLSHVTPSATHNEIRIAKAPELHPLQLTCPSDSGVIHILDTSYGQGQGTADPVTGVIVKGPCHQPIDAMHACQGHHACTLHAEHGALDPCEGVVKRSVISYTCTHPDSIPPTATQVPYEHSPQALAHDFVPPVHMGFGEGQQGVIDFFRHFFHTQAQTSFPFPDGEECEEDAHRLCGGFLKHCGGEWECSLQCMTDQATVLSPQCAAKHPCSPDIQRLCAGTKGGTNEIMSCLKSHSSPLSHECTRLHPCLLDNSPSHCTPIDYDDRIIQPHMPVFTRIPEYLNMLREERDKVQHGSGSGVDDHAPLPFMHLVMPSVVHPPAQTNVFSHGGHESNLLAHEVVEAAAAADGLPLEADDTDEDVVNEDASDFESRVAAHLGSGHFTHILLNDAPTYALDVEPYPHDPSTLHVSVWPVSHSHNQLFDVNEEGQVFWMHAGEDHRHYCLTARRPHFDANTDGHSNTDDAHTHATPIIISELCVHEMGASLTEEIVQAQTWKYDNGRLHHVHSAQCLTLSASIDGGLHQGTGVHLADCSTHGHDPAQTWHWATGEVTQRDPLIFRRHAEAVRAHKQLQALRAGGGTTTTAQHHDNPHMQAVAVHHTAASAAASSHASLLAHEQQRSMDDHAAVQHLEAEVAALRAHQHEDETTIHREQTQLAEAQTSLRRAQERMMEEDRKLLRMEEEFRKQQLEQQHMQQQLDGMEPAVHFFTPLTLTLSILFVGVLAYVFRIYLFPYFVRRYSAIWKDRLDYEHAS